jgi:hypothetical protein
MNTGDFLGNGWSFPFRISPSGGIALTRQVDRNMLLINITYRIRATNDERNLVYPFYLIRSE